MNLRATILSLLLTACATDATAPELSGSESAGLLKLAPTSVDGDPLHRAVVKVFPYAPTFVSGDVVLEPTGLPVIAWDALPVAFTIDASTMTEDEQDDAREAAALINFIADASILVEADTSRVALSVVNELSESDYAGECVGDANQLHIHAAIAGERSFKELGMPPGLWFHEFMHALDYTASDGDIHDSGIMAAEPAAFEIEPRHVAYLRYLGSLTVVPGGA